MEELDGDDWDFSGLDKAGEIELGTGSKSEKTLSTTHSKKRKRKKKGDIDHASADTSADLPSETVDVGPVKKRKKRKRDRAQVQASTSSESQSADGDSAVPDVSETEKAIKKGKKPKLGSKARKLLRGKRSGGDGQRNTAVAVDVSSPDQAIGETATISEEDDEMDMSAWIEMRLHPKLEKALQELKFKEPTPIQRQCIPAAAHKGKVSSLLPPFCVI